MKARPARGLIARKMATMGTAARIKNQRCSAMVNQVRGKRDVFVTRRAGRPAILNLP